MLTLAHRISFSGNNSESSGPSPGIFDATISNGKTSYGGQSVYQNADTQRIRKRGEVEPTNAQDRRFGGRQTRRYKRCKNWNI